MPLDCETVRMDNFTLPASLQEVLIPSLPASGFYVPNFITETEEAYLLQQVSFLRFSLSFQLHYE